MTAATHCQWRAMWKRLGTGLRCSPNFKLRTHGAWTTLCIIKNREVCYCVASRCSIRFVRSVSFGSARNDTIADITKLRNLPVQLRGLGMRLLRKITELVDKDVAANSKPISIIGIALPVVPFMIFVEGAPVDRYPVLAGLAFTASICWGLFVMWRYIRHARVKLRAARNTVGAGTTWVVIVGTVLFILLIAAGDIWLSSKIGWPEAYGFDCHGRGCFFQDLIHSPKLLQGGSAYELGLFILLWSLPACVFGVLAYVLVKRLSRRNNLR